MLAARFLLADPFPLLHWKRFRIPAVLAHYVHYQAVSAFSNNIPEGTHFIIRMSADRESLKEGERGHAHSQSASFDYGRALIPMSANFLPLTAT